MQIREDADDSRHHIRYATEKPADLLAVCAHPVGEPQQQFVQALQSRNQRHKQCLPGALKFALDLRPLCLELQGLLCTFLRGATQLQLLGVQLLHGWPALAQ